MSFPWRSRYAVYLTQRRSVVWRRDRRAANTDTVVFDELADNAVQALKNALAAVPRHYRTDVFLGPDACGIERVAGAAGLKRNDWKALASASAGDQIAVLDRCGAGEVRIAARLTQELLSEVQRWPWRVASARPWATFRTDEWLRLNQVTAGVFAVIEPGGASLLVAQEGSWRHVGRLPDGVANDRVHREAVRLAMAYGLSSEQISMERLCPWLESGQVSASATDSNWFLCNPLGGETHAD